MLLKEANPMKGNFEALLSKLERGEHLCGAYHRFAQDEGQRLVYTNLIVVTDSGESFSTREEAETDKFFQRVRYHGGGVNSGRLDDTTQYYESVGSWSA